MVAGPYVHKEGHKDDDSESVTQQQHPQLLPATAHRVETGRVGFRVMFEIQFLQPTLKFNEVGFVRFVPVVWKILPHFPHSLLWI